MGDEIQYEYYGNDRVSAVTERGGGRVRFFYMPMRNETVVVDDRGSDTTYQYNAFGATTRITKPDGNVIDQEWSADLKLIAYTDEAGFTRTFSYDAAGNLVRATDPLGNSVELTYEPAFNRVISFQDAKGNITRFGI